MTYTVQNTLVKGNGYSYNLNRKIDAERLCHTLNQYEKTITLQQNLEEQFDNITKQIIQLKLSVNTLKDEINTLGDTRNDINSNNRQ